MRDALEQFRDAIRAAGFTPPDVIQVGEFHRFPGAGKGNGNTAGWCKLFSDELCGVFGDHSTGFVKTWRAEQVQAEVVRRPAARTRPAPAPTPPAQDHAALWASGAEPGEACEHPYLVRKQVQAHGIRIADDLLLIPMRDGFGELVGVQKIDRDGGKLFVKGSRKVGAFHMIQTPYLGMIQTPYAGIIIAEGYATGASIFEAIENITTVVAFDCGNLIHVAKALHAKYPKLAITMAADDDHRSADNPGIAKASEAALAVGGLLAVPDFGADRPEGATDFNDLAIHRGADAVKRAIANARPPDIPEGQPKGENATGADPDGPDWPEPRPLPDALASVEPFASELLPDSLRAWCDDISERVQCPPDFVAVAAVAALGAVLGRKVAVRPQERTDWTEVANQWALVVGRPGVMKSPAIEQALAPLRRLEMMAREQHTADLTAFRADEAARKLRAKADEREAEKVVAKNRSADVSHLLRDYGANIEAPTCKRFSTSDTSAESLAELIRLNPNGLLVHRDEMVSLLRDLDREEKASARGFYLTGWNGSTPYTVDRLGRGLDLNIPAVCLSLLGGTQPARLAGYVHTATHGRSGDDGLIQRFGLLVWPDLSGEWRNVDRWPDSSARRTAWETFRRLDELTAEAVDAVQDAGFNGEPEGVPYLRLGESARERFVGWRAELEARLRSRELAPAIESHLSKFRKLVPSLALLFHVADGGSGPVDEAPMLRALAWASYLESHAKRVYGSGPASEAAAARAIVMRIRAGDLLAVFAGWQVWRPGWAGLADRESVQSGLELLVDLDYLAVERIKTGGREATRYTVNPRVLL